MQKEIFIKGARENNLKNIDVTIPRDKLVVLTGLSGSGKSRQKRQKEPPVPSLTGALYNTQNCECVPRVCVRFSSLFRYRIVSAPASLPLMPTPNNASGSTVAPHERQRRKTKVNSSYAAMTAVLRDRAAKGNKFTTQNSVQEVLKPEVSSCPFGYFWVGALRKHAGGMFLASDLGGYAAVVSICACTA